MNKIQKDDNIPMLFQAEKVHAVSQGSFFIHKNLLKLKLTLRILVLFSLCYFKLNVLKNRVSIKKKICPNCPNL